MTAHRGQPRGATPCPRSGEEARRTPCPRGGSQEELSHDQGQGQWLRVPGCDGIGMAKRSYPSLRSGAVAERSHTTTEARGGGQEKQPHIQGAVAALAQEGLEELSHIEGQEGRQ